MSVNEFIPTWNQCLPIFNDTDEFSSAQNEQIHYQKHVVTGNEWSQAMSISDYRRQAVDLLNSQDELTVMEFAQLEDKAVVKYNFRTGEIAVARRSDGKIKTFYHTEDQSYVFRKIQQGVWADPSVLHIMISVQPTDDFDDDPAKLFIHRKISEKRLVLDNLANELMFSFFQNQEIDLEKLYNVIHETGEFRFLFYEIKQLILTEGQEGEIHAIKKEIIPIEVKLEAMERVNPPAFNQALVDIITAEVTHQENFWQAAEENITDIDQLDLALCRRDKLGYALLWINIMQLNQRIYLADFEKNQFCLKKSDINCRLILLRLVRALEYQNSVLIAPDDFFWRKL